MAEHKFVVHEDCQRDHCSICIGGLALCEICGCFEGSLPTECPEKIVDAELQERIYQGQMDYKDGKWVEEPVGWRKQQREAREAPDAN